MGFEEHASDDVSRAGSPCSNPFMNETELRQLCSWPGITWDVKWGGVFVGSVGNRMFCCLSKDDPPPYRLSFKVEDERFLELTDRPGFRPAPYLARARWVTVDDPRTLAKVEARTFLRTAYELIRAKLPKRLQRELQGQDALLPQPPDPLVT